MANAPNSNVTVNQQGEIIMQDSLSGSFYQQHGVDYHHRSDNGIDGSTPLSQVGVGSPPPVQHMHGGHLYHLHHNPPSSDDGSNKKTKRGVLPKQATEILRSWLFSHIVHPYPTEDEKRTLATKTNLTLLQVNNWFINARRRILQPMLDASNSSDPVGSNITPTKPKKVKQSNNRTTERFWPNSITSSSSSSKPDHSPQDDSLDDGKMHHLSDLPPQQQPPGGHPGGSMLKPPSLQYTPPQDQYMTSQQSPNGVMPYEHTMTSSAPLPLSMVNR